VVHVALVRFATADLGVSLDGRLEFKCESNEADRERAHHHIMGIDRQGHSLSIRPIFSLSSDAQLHSVAETGAGLGPPYSRGHQPKLMSGVYTVVMDEIHLSFYY
jgi:hypothetical protein